jgi:hypothetical protein
VSNKIDGAHRKTYQLLLSCLRGYWDPPALTRALLLIDDAVNWELWLEQVQSQQIAPLIYETLRGQQLLPPELERTLRQAYLHNAMRNNLLSEELATISSEMQAADIPAILLKGAALVETVYDNAAVRPMVDQDLLVKSTSVKAAQTVLADLDYVINSLDPWPGFGRRYRQVAEHRRAADGDLFYLVDLHWGIVDIPYYQHIPIEDWFTRAPPAPANGVKALVPAPEDHLICLCSHLALHERYSPDLLRYSDIATLIARTGRALDWDAVLQRATDWQLVMPLQRALVQLEALWPGTVPIVITRKIVDLRPASNEHRIHRWVIDRYRNPTSDVLLFVATTPGLRRKARLLLEQALPSPAYMRERYDLQRPSLWPLAYIRRAILTLRYLKGDPG